MGKSRSSPWPRPQPSPGSHTRTGRPNPPWGRSKTGAHRPTHPTRQPSRSFPTTPDSPNEMGSAHQQQGFGRDDPGRDIANEAPRDVQRDVPRWPYSLSSPEERVCGKEFRHRISAFSRISLPRSTLPSSRTSTRRRDTDVHSTPHDSTARKRIKASPFWESHLQVEHLRVEQHDHWMNQENDHGKPRMVMASPKEPKPYNVYTSQADLTRRNPSYDVEKKLVWEFACALAHAYLHQDDREALPEPKLRDPNRAGQDPNGRSHVENGQDIKLQSSGFDHDLSMDVGGSLSSGFDHDLNMDVGGQHCWEPIESPWSNKRKATISVGKSWEDPLHLQTGQDVNLQDKLLGLDVNSLASAQAIAEDQPTENTWSETTSGVGKPWDDYLQLQAGEDKLVRCGFDRDLNDPDNHKRKPKMLVGKPWDADPLHVEDRHSELQKQHTVDLDRKEAWEHTWSHIRKPTTVTGLRLICSQSSEVCMEEVVNPTQAAAWFGEKLVSHSAVASTG